MDLTPDNIFFDRSGCSDHAEWRDQSVNCHAKTKKSPVSRRNIYGLVSMSIFMLTVVFWLRSPVCCAILFSPPAPLWRIIPRYVRNKCFCVSVSVVHLLSCVVFGEDRCIPPVAPCFYMWFTKISKPCNRNKQYKGKLKAIKIFVFINVWWSELTSCGFILSFIY